MRSLRLFLPRLLPSSFYTLTYRFGSAVAVQQVDLARQDVGTITMALNTLARHARQVGHVLQADWEEEEASATTVP